MGNWSWHEVRGRARAFRLDREVVMIFLTCTSDHCEDDAAHLSRFDRFAIQPR